MVHLEEESGDGEKYIIGDEPDGIIGETDKFIICLLRAVKDAQKVEKCCYYCGSPDHFIHDCPLLVGAKANPPLNHKEGTALMKGAWAPQGKVLMPKVSQDGTPQA